MKRSLMASSKALVPAAAAGSSATRLLHGSSHTVSNSIRHSSKLMKNPPTIQRCDVFINHRGADTKRTIAGLLYNQLRGMGLHPFLDSKSMKPGDLLFDKIDTAIKGCKVGIAVFSPTYCDSYFCLHELALMMESKKKIIPIFCDVKPSELHVEDDGTCSAAELSRFREALKLARYTVGLTFDTSKGDWSEFLTSATDIVVQSLLEIEERRYHAHNVISSQDQRRLN